MQHFLRSIKRKFRNMSSVTMIPLGFFLLILCGAIVLTMPISTADHCGTSFLTALFTATTSVCVTGSIVVPTFSYWSIFGKVVILILIQFGGLGIIAVSSVAIYLTRQRFSLRHQLLLRDTFDLETFNGVSVFLNKVIKGTMMVEMLGALLYSIRFIPKYGVLRGIWYSVFTAISAFCNAGIDILGPNSLEDYHSDYLVLLTTMLMIVMGGIGYVVWFDLQDCINIDLRPKTGLIKFHRNLNEHSRLVLRITAALIFGGALLIFLMEYSNDATLGTMSLPDKIMNAIFQSVTARTAGFASISQSGLQDCSTLVIDVLMFIGGSPVGTAGGIKTVTFFILLLNFVSFIRSRNEIVIFKKKINNANLRKAAAIFTVNLLLVLITSTLLSYVEDIDMTDCLYEVCSAVSTVGLSRDITGTLSTAGQITIIIDMFLGRIGPISMALLLGASTSKQNHVSFGDGHFFIG